MEGTVSATLTKDLGKPEKLTARKLLKFTKFHEVKSWIPMPSMHLVERALSSCLWSAWGQLCLKRPWVGSKMGLQWAPMAENSAAWWAVLVWAHTEDKEKGFSSYNQYSLGCIQNTACSFGSPVQKISLIVCTAQLHYFSTFMSTLLTHISHAGLFKSQCLFSHSGLIKPGIFHSWRAKLQFLLGYSSPSD